MKKTVIILLSLILIFNSISFLNAFADDEEEFSSNYTCSFDSETGVLTINGSGEINTYGDRDYSVIGYYYYDWVKYKDEAKTVVIGEGIENIPEGAFTKFSKLSSVQLPSTLKKVGYGAFVLCKKLKSIDLPENTVVVADYAFRSCRSLQKITLGKNIATLYSGCFLDCPNLNTISLDSENPDFKYSDGGIYTSDYKTLITVERGIKSFKPHKNTTKISRFAFNNSNVKSFEIPKKVTSFAAAFYRSNIQKITFEKGSKVKEIKTLCLSQGDDCGETYGTFDSCFKLKSISLPSSVKKIDYFTFTNCQKLEKLHFSKNVNQIGYYNFFNTLSLKKLTVDKNNKTFSSKKGCLYLKNNGLKILAAVCSNQKKITIDKKTDMIGRLAFQGSKIKSIAIPENVKYIVEGAFSSCKKLSKINFAKNGKLEVIGYSLGELIDVGEEDYRKSNNLSSSPFDNCTSLKTLALPNSLKYVMGAFSSCKKLQKMHIGKNFKLFLNSYWDDCYNDKYSKSWNYKGKATFDGPSNAKGMKSFTVAKSNKYFSSKNGVIYNKKQTKLLKYPVAKKGKSFTVGKKVTSIGNYAFFLCKYLKKIKIPENVKELGYFSVGFKYGIDEYGYNTEVVDKSVTILCKKNSKAYKYAKQNGVNYKFY